jgi:hypothetical protein
LRHILITFIAVLLLTGPARAQDTWCMYDEIAQYIHEYIPIASGILSSLGVELPDALPLITAEADGLLTELRDASMGPDPDDAVKDVLIRRGLDKLAQSLGPGDWKSIWAGADRVSPVLTAAMYRVDESGVEQGYLLRIAWYLVTRGDIVFAPGEEITTVAVLNKLLYTLPNARFTPEEEDIGIVWLAEEIAAARNLRRADMAAPTTSGEYDDLPLAQ